MTTGTDAFKPVGRVARTPPSVSDKHNVTVGGPLSSTHIECGGSGHSSTLDPLAVRLFETSAASPSTLVL